MEPTIQPSTATYQQIPVEKIVPSSHQARKDFDDESIEGLAESIKQEGLLEPIIVRPVNGSFELISGERRLRAVKILKRSTIDAKVIQTVSESEAAAKGLVENLQREDLNPIEEAEGFNTLNKLNPTEWTHEKIARIAGRSRVYITQSIGILELPELIKADVSRLTLSRSHALELMRLPNKEQQLAVAKQIPGRLTREETRKLVDSMLGGSASAHPKPEPPSDPCETLWTPLLKDPAFPKEDWEVKYRRGGTWVFTVHTQDGNPAEVLSSWFKFMLKAMPRAAPADRPEFSGQVPPGVIAAKSPEELMTEIKKSMPPEMAGRMADRLAQIEAAAKAHLPKKPDQDKPDDPAKG